MKFNITAYIRLITRSTQQTIPIIQKRKKIPYFTSFPLVSPFSNHSTVTLLVAGLTAEQVAEWTRPGKKQPGLDD